MLLPAAGFRRSSERFGTDELAPVHVGHRGGQLGVAGVAAAAHPELAHGNVAVAPELEIVRRAVAIGLQGVLQPRAAGHLGELPGVVLREEVGDGPAQIPEEALGDLGAVHDAAREDGQEALDVIAAAPLELLVEALRPVLAAHFVAVDQHVVESGLDLAGQEPEFGQHGAHHAVPMGLRGLLAELVAFEAGARGRGGMVLAAVGGVAHAEDRPVARRHVPGQLPVGGHGGGEVHGLVALDHRAGIQVGDGRAAHAAAAHGEGLPGQIVDSHPHREVHLGDAQARHPAVGTGDEHAEDAGGDRGEGNGGHAAVARHGEALDGPELLAVVRGLHLAAASPHTAGEADLRHPRRVGFGKGELDEGRRVGSWQTQLHGRARAAVDGQGAVLPLGADRGRRCGIAHARQFALGSAEGQDRDVAVEVQLRARLWQRPLEAGGALGPHFAGDDDLHAVLGRVPGPAAARPARAVVDAKLDPEPPRLGRRVPHQRQPLGAVEDHRPLRNAAVRVEDLRPAHAHAGHRLEVGRDAFPGDVPVHPVPPRVRPCRGRGPHELLFQAGRSDADCQTHAENREGDAHLPEVHASTPQEVHSVATGERPAMCREVHSSRSSRPAPTRARPKGNASLKGGADSPREWMPGERLETRPASGGGARRAARRSAHRRSEPCAGHGKGRASAVRPSVPPPEAGRGSRGWDVSANRRPAARSPLQ